MKILQLPIPRSSSSALSAKDAYNFCQCIQILPIDITNWASNINYSRQTTEILEREIHLWIIQNYQ
jgi:hypothetical protein